MRMHPLWLLLFLSLVVPSLAEGVFSPMSSEMLQKCHERCLKMVGDLPYNNADEITPGLWVGNLCASRDKEFLRRNHITLVVSVVPERITEEYHGKIHYVSLPYIFDVFDGSGSADGSVDKVFSLVIEHTLGVENEGILVYCESGISLSTTLVASYLLAFSPPGLDNVEAIGAYIREKRPVASINTAYVSLLRHFWLRARTQQMRAYYLDNPNIFWYELNENERRMVRDRREKKSM